jgi:hypothetical protein
MGAVTRARNASLGIEVNQLATAVQSYKDDKGDYPPNFRPGMESAFLNHVRRCYPKIAPSELNWFFSTPTGVLQYPDGSLRFNPDRIPDEGEALVFWLSHTTTDPRYPFGLTVPAATSSTSNYKKYYEFDESRLEDIEDADLLPSYKAKFCKDTYYIYIDSRFYDYFTHDFRGTSTVPPPTTNVLPPNPVFACAEGTVTPTVIDATDENKVRPYWSNNLTEKGKLNPNLPTRQLKKPMNETTFQVLCAGQDGNFGLTDAAQDVKIFPAGDYYEKADRDNITSFSAGKRLEDSAGKEK